MKKLLLSAVVLFMGMLGVQAQDRSAYSFKVTPHVNQEDELIDSITVDVLVDGVKTYLDFSTQLFTPQSPDIVLLLSFLLFLSSIVNPPCISF